MRLKIVFTALLVFLVSPALVHPAIAQQPQAPPARREAAIKDVETVDAIVGARYQQPAIDVRRQALVDYKHHVGRRAR